MRRMKTKQVDLDPVLEELERDGKIRRTGLEAEQRGRSRVMITLNKKSIANVLSSIFMPHHLINRIGLDIKQLGQDFCNEIQIY